MPGFDTLRGPWRLRRELLVAVLVVAAFEAFARFQVSRGHWALGESLAGVVQSFQQALAAEQPQVWLLGNSTLNCGVDKDTLAARVGRPVALLVHSSSTLRASAAMLDYYMRHTPRPPERVLVAVTLDDLHRSGYRSQISQTYLDINLHDTLPPGQSPLTLRAARESILGSVGIRHWLQHWRDSLKQSGEAGEVKPAADSGSWSGEEIPDTDPTFKELDAHFEMDTDGVRELAALSRRSRIPCTLVLLPVTVQMQRYHDRQNPALTYSQIRWQLAEHCQEHGLPFQDWGAASAEGSLFKDPYHMNENGRRLATQKIADLLNGSNGR